MKKINLDVVKDFLSGRSPREKMMFAGLAITAMLFLDTYFWLRPVIGALGESGPKLSALKKELRGMKDDKKNQALIQKDWQETQEKLSGAEARFIASNEVPALLENLSQLAQESGVKIISLKPIDDPKPAKKSFYTKVPIELSAQAGTHELGKFLAKMESGKTFFRVSDIRIAENSAELKKHLIELRLETYRKG